MNSYKLLDDAGYIVDSGDIFLDALNAGDKFKDNSVTLDELIPGETYTFQLSEYTMN